MEEFHPLNRLPTHDVNTRTRVRNPRKWVIRAKFAYAKLALLMVVAGLAGEGIFEYLAARAETSIRQYDENILAGATKDAGDAKHSAEGAVNASATAKGLADAADVAAGKAQSTVSAVGKRAESIDQELSMVQYLLEPRKVLNPDDLKKQMGKFKGKTIFFKSYFNDSDGYFLCKELVSVADSAGVVSNDQCGVLVVKPPFTLGINVFAPDLGTMLALNAAMSGVTPYGSGGGVNGTTNIVFVGRKNTSHVGPTAQTRDAEKRAANLKKTQPSKK